MRTYKHKFHGHVISGEIAREDGEMRCGSSVKQRDTEPTPYKKGDFLATSGNEYGVIPAEHLKRHYVEV